MSWGKYIPMKLCLDCRLVLTWHPSGRCERCWWKRVRPTGGPSS